MSNPPYDITQVNEKYICKICRKIYEKPHQAECGCIYCLICIFNLLEKNICKVCNKPWSKLKKVWNKELEKEIENMDIRCMKCSWVGKFTDFEKHYEAHINSCIEFLKTSILELQSKLCMVEDMVEIEKETTYDGNLIWKIKNVNKLFKEEKVAYSPEFFTHQQGYKLKVRICFKISVKCNQQYITIHLIQLKNEYNQTLDLESNYKLKITLLDQSINEVKQNIPVTLDSVKLQRFEESLGLDTLESAEILFPLSHDLMKNISRYVMDDAYIQITLESNKTIINYGDQSLKTRNKKICFKISIDALASRISSLEGFLLSLIKFFHKSQSNQLLVIDYDKIPMKYQNEIKDFVKRAIFLQTHSLHIEQKINSFVYATYDGTFEWKITHVSDKVQEEKSGRQTSIYSSPFYTSQYGYKMCARLFLNGDGIGRNTHLSLFLVIMRGEYDSLLKWPFKQKVTFMLMDQSTNESRENIIDAFRPDPNSDSFKKPTSDMNIAIGIPQFCPLSKLNSTDHEYIKDDCMFIKIIVDCTDLENERNSEQNIICF